MKNCLTCQAEFKVRNKTQKYCSHTCSTKHKRKAVLVICPCGTAVVSSKSHPKKYCGSKCRKLARTTRISLVCLVCIKSFSVQKKKASQGAKYCSSICAGKAKRGKGQVELICEVCTKIFSRSEARVGSHVFCSQQCYKIALQVIRHQKGKDNPNWKGGVKLAKPGAFYRTKEWRSLRRKILNRDEHTCRQCGVVGNQVNHIKPRSTHPELALTPSNLETLCLNCHRVLTKSMYATGLLGKFINV